MTPEVDTEYAPYILQLREETPRALADLIERAASMPDSELDELGDRARHFIRREKTWARAGKTHRQLSAGDRRRP
jgi:hypothetical protein